MSYARELVAIELARHHDIGEQQIDMRAGLEHANRGVGVLGFPNDVAEIDELADDGATHRGVVLDHEHGLAATAIGTPARWRRCLDHDISRARKVKAKRGADAFLAYHINLATGLSQKAEHHAEAEPGAGA